MMIKKFARRLIVAVSLVGASSYAAVVDDMLKEYQLQGASNFAASRGEELWHKKFPDPENPGKTQTCGTCHGDDLKQKGKHATTNKVIDPMAPTVNKDRLTDPKFIEKWFKRNCKSVLGRECTPQEKGDVLSYLRGL
jgi:hypothetical protein